MSTINKFEDLQLWQKARELSTEIYDIVNKSLISQDYALKNQILRSVGSIMDNVAEGFERGGKKEFIQFLYIAKGSSAEIRSQLYRALDNKYIQEDNFKILYEKSNDICKMINGLVSYLNSSEYKGIKFK